MPRIGSSITLDANRRELYAEQEEQVIQGNRSQVIPPTPADMFVELQQIIPQGGIPGDKIGPIVDTGNSGVTSVGDQSTDVRFWAGATFANRASAPFRVTKDGYLYAAAASIPAPSSIAGFDIGADYIRDTANSFGLASTVTGGDDVRFWAGATFANRSTAPLRITESGVVVASSITATGTINATGGYIGSTTALVYESTGINTGTTGHIRGGQTDYDTGIGYFLGYYTTNASYVFSIGEGGNPYNNLRWDGSNLYVNNRLLSTDPIFGDGSDGDVIVNENLTLTRDMFYNKFRMVQAGAAPVTFNPTVDGVVYRTSVGSAFASLRSSAGNGSDSVSQTLTLNMVGTSAGSTWDTIRRAILVFDTSSIPDNAVITAATLSLYAESKNDVASQSVSIATRTDPGTIGDSGYDIANWTMTKQATDIAISAISVGAYNVFTLNATGLATINKTGNTMLCPVLSADIDNTEPTWSASVTPQVVFRSADDVNKPILSITYSLAATFNTATGTSGDGYARRISANSVFSTLRTSAGTAANSSDANITVQLDTGTTTDRFDRIDRGILTFDTSTLPDDATISSATLSLYVNSKTDNMSQSIDIATRTDPGTIASGDYDIANWTMVRQATGKTITSITTSAYNVWDLNATGIASISKTGSTFFGVVLSADIDNSAPTWSSNIQADINFDSADGTNKPILTIVYSVASPVLNPNGYRIFAKKYIAIDNGSVVRAGNVGGNGGAGGAASGSTAGTPGGAAGAAASALASGSIFGSIASQAGIIGGVGGLISVNTSPNAGNGTAGTAQASSVGSTAVAGVAGAVGGKCGSGVGTPGTAGTAGAAGAMTVAASSIRNYANASLMFDPPAGVIYKGSSGAGGTGGSSGGSTDGSNSANSGGGGAAGGSGGTGGNGPFVLLASPIITVGSGASILAPGGAGGVGGNGGAGGTASGAGRNGGGGGAAGSGGSGGDGGIIVLMYISYTNSGTVAAAAGAGGTAGTVGAGGVGSGGATTGNSGGSGTTGNTGNAGKIIELSLN